jgi:hypothetical protein
MVELQEFIGETLKQVINGVTTAQEHAKQKGAKINPSNLSIPSFQNSQDIVFIDTDTNVVARTIEFDVAITVSESESSKAGVGIFVGEIGIGAQGKSSGSNNTVSRIKFSLPILFPHQ